MVVDSREQGSTRVKDCNSALSQYILLECISRGRATREFLEGPQRVQVSWKNSRRKSALRCACEISTLKKRKFWVRVYEEKHHDGHHRLPRTSARFSNTSQSRYTHSPPRSTNILPRDTLSSSTSNIVTGSDLPKTNYAACVAERHPGQGRFRFNLAALATVPGNQCATLWKGAYTRQCRTTRCLGSHVGSHPPAGLLETRHTPCLPIQNRLYLVLRRAPLDD